jgi:predicted ATPase with chaperone activity
MMGKACAVSDIPLCMTQLHLSAKVYHRLLKLARTIANLVEALHALQSSEVNAELVTG